MTKRIFMTLLALVGMTAMWATQPNRYLDVCMGGEGLIHVQGWAYDPDASALSIDVHVYVYTDAGCTSQYGDVHVLTANVSRPDVNAARNITGDHGFNADIPIADAGDYWVKVFAIDTNGDGNPQIGATTAVTVTVTTPPTPTPTPTNGPTLLNGDLNHDDVIDSTDVTAIVNVALGRRQPEIVVLKSNVHEFVDLGLPSHTLWATTNIGADNPEDYGDYFAWGETTGFNSGKSFFDWSTYRFYQLDYGEFLIKYCGNSLYGYRGFTDDLTELVPEDDVAYVHWGPEWRMPSLEQLEELHYECTWRWTERNGVIGQEVVGPNGNSIFLPAAGYREDDELKEAGSGGYYWSRAFETDRPRYAYHLQNNSLESYKEREYGLCVRPVFVATVTTVIAQTMLNGDQNHSGAIDIADVTALVNAVLGKSQAEEVAVSSVAHEAVDLGLPSGTLWATMNIGATSPEDYGDYFAWGETTGYLGGKDIFGDNYRFIERGVWTKYCNTDKLTELLPEDDAAYVNWGVEWRMPTREQLEELFNKKYCDRIETTRNGVHGYELVSYSNGNSIFLPAAGRRRGNIFRDAGEDCYYWSRTLYTNAFFPEQACCLNDIQYAEDRLEGLSVRPVVNR